MNTDEPLVSVLTPVWNEEAHIGEMLDSLQRQTDPRWEVVLVDDGSTDATVSIIRARAADEPRIRLAHHGAKLGKVAAFNKAFEASRGAIICHLGGDDVATENAAASRIAALVEQVDSDAAAFFKLRMFSAREPEGAVLPRGRAGSRSGPSTTLTRPLAEKIFPIPTGLPSEDLWVSAAAHALAANTVHSPDVVVNYRAHEGNSNPRSKTFEDMSASIHARMHYIPALLAEPRFDFDKETRRQFKATWEAEQLRHKGRTMALLFRSGLPFIDRAALAAMSNRQLWRLRQKAYFQLSGWRGR